MWIEVDERSLNALNDPNPFEFNCGDTTYLVSLPHSLGNLSLTIYTWYSHSHSIQLFFSLDLDLFIRSIQLIHPGRPHTSFLPLLRHRYFYLSFMILYRVQTWPPLDKKITNTTLKTQQVRTMHEHSTIAEI